jgi:outer membrane protein insertion porin family
MITKALYNLIRDNHNNPRNQRLPSPFQRCSIFFFLLLIAPSLFSQSILKIEINGNTNFSNQEYFSWIKIGTGSKSFPGIEDTIKHRISEALRSEGYFHFEIIKIEPENIDSIRQNISIDVRENSPTLLNKIYFNHTETDSTFLERNFSIISLRVFNNIMVESAISNILTEYENTGRPFAKVNIESIYFFDDSTTQKHYADLYLKIDQGKQSIINKFEISGNSKTREYVITRSIGVGIDELYNQKKIDDIPVRLNRLRFFEPVGSPEFYFNSKDEGILKLTVREKETNNFDGIIGYIPGSAQNEKGFITGFVNINLRNLFGTGRAAAFKWQQESRYSQELEIRYLEPWLFDFPFNVEAGIFQRKQDSTYVQRSAEGKLEYIATDEISAGLTLSTQSTIPTERINKLFTVFNSTAYTTGLNLRIDTRNDFYAPTKGIILNNSYKYTSKQIDGPKEFVTPLTKTKVNFQRLEIDFSYFLELFSEQVVAASIHARELKGDDVEISDLYLLGGTNTLRGYREKQFAGNRIFWSNLEYRLLLSNRSFAFLFLDTGYFLRNEDASRNIVRVSDFKFGYGLGFNIETALGVLGVSFALGKGDSFRDGKIHFGIVNEF